MIFWYLIVFFNYFIFKSRTKIVQIININYSIDFVYITDKLLYNIENGLLFIHQ